MLDSCPHLPCCGRDHEEYCQVPVLPWVLLMPLPSPPTPMTPHPWCAFCSCRQTDKGMHMPGVHTPPACQLIWLFLSDILRIERAKGCLSSARSIPHTFCLWLHAADLSTVISGVASYANAPLPEQQVSLPPSSLPPRGDFGWDSAGWTVWCRSSELALCPLLPWYCVKSPWNIWFKDYQHIFYPEKVNFHLGKDYFNLISPSI